MPHHLQLWKWSCLLMALAGFFQGSPAMAETLQTTPSGETLYGMDSRQTPAPPPAQLEFLGLPSSEWLRSIVVARTRTPVFAMQGGDAVFVDALEKSRDRDRKNPGYYMGASERQGELQKLGEPARPGELLGYVRRGFLFHSLNTKDDDAAPVLFSKTIGGAHFGAVRPEDFIILGSPMWRKWWNPAALKEGNDLPDKDIYLQPLGITANTVLLDPFEATTVVLVNTDGTMLRAWSVKGRPAVPPKNGGLLTIVETRDGLFLGYRIEKGEGGLSSLTWEQAAAQTNNPYFLKAKPPQLLKKGTPVFTLFDIEAAVQNYLPSNNPADFVIGPELYAKILESGSWALKTTLIAPKDGGFEPLPTVGIQQKNPALEIQTKLQRVRALFESLDEAHLRLTVASDYEKREVEHAVNARGVDTMTAKPWQKVREQRTVELALPTDGALRFTDGTFIYQAAPGALRHPYLTVYAIEKNELYRPRESQ